MFRGQKNNKYSIQNNFNKIHFKSMLNVKQNQKTSLKYTTSVNQY